MASDKQQKLQALQAAISGNTQPLRDIKAKQGRPYTDGELEERRQYLTGLCSYEATQQDVFTFFGRFAPMVPSAQAYRLPNGMLLYF